MQTKTIKDLKTINFPIYRLRSDNVLKVGKLLTLDGEVLDDKDWPGKSIGIRRLQSQRDNLYKLAKPIFTVNQLIESKYKNFIDNKGIVFYYQKTKRHPIKYHKIKKMVPKETYTFVYLHDITIPFEIKRPPVDWPVYSYCRVLYYNKHPWLIFEFCKIQGKDTNKFV